MIISKLLFYFIVLINYLLLLIGSIVGLTKSSDFDLVRQISSTYIFHKRIHIHCVFQFIFILCGYYLLVLRFATTMNCTDDEYWNEKSFDGFSFEDEVLINTFFF